MAASLWKDKAIRGKTDVGLAQKYSTTWYGHQSKMASLVSSNQAVAELKSVVQPRVLMTHMPTSCSLQNSLRTLEV